MTRPDDALEAASAVRTSSPAPKYEAPRLTPIGNLRDVLAATTGSACDGTNNPATGSDPSLCL